MHRSFLPVLFFLMDSEEIIFRKLNPQQQRDLRRGTVLQRRNMKFYMLKSLFRLPCSVRDSIDFSNLESVKYWTTHVGDPLLDIIFDLYLTENRRHTRIHGDIPDTYVALFNAQNVHLTRSHIDTFLHDALVEARAEDIEYTKQAKRKTVVSPLERKKLPAIKDKSLLNTLLSFDPTKLQITPKKTKEILPSTPMTSAMEGPEFPPLILREKQHAPNTLLSKGSK